ncbi:hypothetical protein Tco_0158896 [Tanacetum coccineum]
MPTQTIPMLSKKPMIASSDIHKIGLGFSNPWYGRKAQLSQPALYDGHRLLQPGHARVTVHDSDETLLETEVSRMKMSQKPGHVKPIDYAKLNALYDQFVPQKELSREQAYWLSATDIASLTSDPPKPVTPFVRTSPAKSQVQDQLCIRKESDLLCCFCMLAPISDCMCAELRSSCDREHNRVLELEAKISKHKRLITESEKPAKPQVTGKTSSGSTASEKPKVLASGMYTNSSKYVPPPKRANWVAECGMMLYYNTRDSLMNAHAR